MDQARELLLEFQVECTELVLKTIQQVSPESTNVTFGQEYEDICSMEPQSMELSYNAAFAENAAILMSGVMLRQEVIKQFGEELQGVGSVVGIALSLVAMYGRYRSRVSRREKEN